MPAKRLFLTITILFSLLFSNFSQARDVSIPDANLAAAIRQEIGNAITTDTLLNLKRLEARNSGIKDLTGLEHAHNLEHLDLGGEYIEGEGSVNSNTISDFLPIVGLTNLGFLGLTDCSISDGSFLAKLTQLTYLHLSNNPISDVSPLAGLTQLRLLYLRDTSISDISALSELTQLSTLDISGSSLSDVSPLSKLTQLTDLYLNSNNMLDISALSGLTQLTSLSIGSNAISDISPLAGLTQLVELSLWNNAISDVSPLKGLTQLTSLNLSGNEILDVSLLSGLTQLNYLYLSGNAISDISALSNLTQLEVLSLSNNGILDVSPLVRLNLTGTKRNSTGLYIENNPLSYASINTHIPAMQAKGAEVKFDARVPTTLLKISGIAQEGVINTALPLPFVVEVLDAEDRAFAGVPVKFAVATGSGQLDATTVRTDATGKAAARLTLGRTVGPTTVRVTATDVSQPVQFTATAILRSSPVIIPDVNLRMRIMETLRKPVDATPTVSDMLRLTTLTANSANIRDLTGLQHAVNLTRLSLRYNRISNLSPLAGLTQLTTLDLRNNWILDILPLIGLTQLKGATDWNSLYLQGNPLSDLSIDTYIPMLQAAGTDLRFDSILTQQQPIVRLIYFVPRDRQPQPNIDAILDARIKEVQQLFAAAMERHGYGRKTFRFETDWNGNAIVHHVTGKHADDHYLINTVNKVFDETGEHFDRSKNIYFFVTNISSELINLDNGSCSKGYACAVGTEQEDGGYIMQPASGSCFGDKITAHELGHAFGLNHNFRSHDNIISYMSYSPFADTLSAYEAEWLNVHPYLNPTQHLKSNSEPTIEMLSVKLEPFYNVRFRFKLTDPDGLHQAQLTFAAGSSVLGAESLSGKSQTIEFITRPRLLDSFRTELHLIDKHGNIATQYFRDVDAASELLSDEIIPIPDPKLVEVLREELDLEENRPITHTDMLAFVILDASNSGITDLTGLQHALNLEVIGLGPDLINYKYVNTNGVSDFSPLKGLPLLTELHLYGHSSTDLSNLSELTQLKTLDLISNGVSDVAPLANLTRLQRLYLSHNNISDIAPLANLTDLYVLRLYDCDISDISPVANLTQLRNLDIDRNNISDIAPLANLTHLYWLGIGGCDISDISPLANLTQLRRLDLASNNIIDISPLAGLTRLTKLVLDGTHYPSISQLAKVTQWEHLRRSSTNIIDISSIAGLTQLETLSLGFNNIIDISPLAELTQLTDLRLHANSISDVSPLTRLTHLKTLSLAHNNISDVSALEGLERLEILLLSSNDITDVSPLVGLNLTGETQDSTGLYIQGNPLDYASIYTHIPAMQAKGIEVVFDNRTPTTLLKISSAAQQGTVNTTLPFPFVVEVRDQHNAAFAGVPVTFTVISGGGKLSATTVPTDAAGRASAHLTLGRTADTTTVRIAAAEISQPVQFTTTAVLLSAPVAITDTNLRGKIAETLDKPRGGTLTLADMLELTTLVANNANIRDLTGLQHAPNLKILSLDNNNLSDISRLGALTQLTLLSLDGNNISDVSPLGVLTELDTLLLDNNNLSDVTHLSGLTQLKTLSLNNNSISNIAPLEALTELKLLQLKGNLLSYPSLHTSVPAIQASSATVTVDLRTPTTLVKVSGTHGVAGEDLPVIVEVQDEQGLGFSGVPITFTVTAGGGHLSASNVITDNTGRARTTLTLGITPGKNTVRAAAAQAPRPVSFTITAIDANSPITIPDVNLRAKIAEALDIPRGMQLTEGDMLALEELNAPNANIQDLTGLEHAHNLKELNFADVLKYIPEYGRYVSVNSNAISDFSPIAGLHQLKDLNLSSTGISDFSPIAGLHQLKDLNLSSTGISDFSPIAGLHQLRDLNLSSTGISDFSPLANLTKLTDLNLDDNSISDVSSLANLTQLTRLNLSRNTISDVSSLANLTQLTRLNLSRNTISDVSSLANLTQLTSLDLSRNTISDISPLANLTKLRYLYITRNPLNYASIHTHIPAMQAKWIEVSFDNRVHSALVKISGDTQEGEAGTTLANPFVVEALDEHGVAITGRSVTFRIIEGNGKLSIRTAITDADGRVQTTLTLGPNPGVNKIRVTAEGITYPVSFTATATEVTRLAADVNGDGIVNIQDLVLVSSSLGQMDQSSADVNGDGVVNVQDLVLVAGALGQGTAASPSLHPSDIEGLTVVEVQDMLTQARQMALTDPAYLRGIAVLEQLLALLLPKETALLPNYPNPFNPETWIPYQLAKPAEVTLHLYAMNGALVRVLALGHQSAGMYHGKSRAAYWDGKNEVGESVASGVYFYTLTAGTFTATRQMLIMK